MKAPHKPENGSRERPSDTIRTGTSTENIIRGGMNSAFYGGLTNQAIYFLKPQIRRSALS